MTGPADEDAIEGAFMKLKQGVNLDSSDGPGSIARIAHRYRKQENDMTSNTSLRDDLPVRVEVHAENGELFDPVQTRAFRKLVQRHGGVFHRPNSNDLSRVEFESGYRTELRAVFNKGISTELREGIRATLCEAGFRSVSIRDVGRRHVQVK
jgi:hypothetical protein